MCQKKRVEIPPLRQWLPGWYPALSNHDYHASEGASSSYLKKFLEHTPFEIKWLELYTERKTNAAFDLGTAVHTLVLEPNKVASTIAIRPDVNLRTKEGRNIAEIFEQENAGKVILTFEQFETARAMAHELLNHKIAATLLEGAIVEQSVFWTHDDEESGINQLLKVRPDALSRTTPLMLDVKTCDNASWEAMRHAVIKYRYNLSAAMYLHGVNQCAALLDECEIDEYLGFCLLCVESKPPHQVACYEIGIDLLMSGRSDFFTALKRLQRTVADGWPSYPPMLRVLDAPKWNPAPPIL